MLLLTRQEGHLSYVVVNKAGCAFPLQQRTTLYHLQATKNN